jgi:hypothetical protein
MAAQVRFAQFLRHDIRYRVGAIAADKREPLATIRGDYSFEVFNGDYRQPPPPVVAERA